MRLRSCPESSSEGRGGGWGTGLPHPPREQDRALRSVRAQSAWPWTMTHGPGFLITIFLQIIFYFSVTAGIQHYTGFHKGRDHPPSTHQRGRRRPSLSGCIFHPFGRRQRCFVRPGWARAHLCARPPTSTFSRSYCICPGPTGAGTPGQPCKVVVGGVIQPLWPWPLPHPPPHSLQEMVVQ